MRGVVTWLGVVGKCLVAACATVFVVSWLVGALLVGPPSEVALVGSQTRLVLSTRWSGPIAASETGYVFVSDHGSLVVGEVDAPHAVQPEALRETLAEFLAGVQDEHVRVRLLGTPMLRLSADGRMTFTADWLAGMNDQTRRGSVRLVYLEESDRILIVAIETHDGGLDTTLALDDVELLSPLRLATSM